MKKNDSNSSKFVGKKFIITMAVCLAVIVGAGVYSYNRIANNLENELGINNESSLTDDGTPVGNEQQEIVKSTEVAEEVSDIPVEATTDIPDANLSEQKTMVKPVDGEIINSFSNGELVKSKTLNVWKTHDGIDIMCNADENVKSMTSGVVSTVKQDPLWGYCVIIDHGNGIEGHYYGLGADVLVTEGMEVATGTIIGSAGNTAECEIAEGSHLHFGVKENGEWVDPAVLLSGEGS